MHLLRAFLFSALALQAACIQYEIPEVAAIVADLLVNQTDYVHFQGNQTNSTTSGPSTSTNVLDKRSTPYWYENIAHQGISAFGATSYQVYRNVKDFGAKGDGVTDDTAAINNAIASGNRCGQGCVSTTTTPAVVYFPAGTYKISSSLIVYYYTQMIGDPNDRPVLQATSTFSGFGLIDGDHYYTSSLNWKATNVFYRQVRNFVLDMTNIPSGSAATGIHWPTAQATSLQNIVFQMSSASGTQHAGLFIEDGSGGFLTDLTFNGGLIGAHVGNQQFTMRNLEFNDCVSAIVQSWSWGWVYQGLSINNCQVGIDISALSASNTLLVGSVTVLDSSITNTQVGILTAYSSSSQPSTGGTLAIENIILSNVATAIKYSGNGATVLAGSTGKFTIPGWGEGHKYSATGGPSSFQGYFTPDARPSSLLSGSNYYVRSKPQYNTLAVSSFQSVRSAGATGNGVTDDTTALQNIINSATSNGQVVFFDAGTYLVTKTLSIPPGAKLVGESYSVIMSSGSFFNDMSNPKPVVQVGTAGQTGQVEWSDMIVSTQGEQAGAILIEWNLAAPANAPSGMWDVHARIGGFKGSQQQVAQCQSNPGSTAIDTACIAAYMTMHVTSGASGLYMENVWFWTADHDIDDSNNTQLTVYAGRGLFVESMAGNMWLYGTAVEHHTLYQYQFANTKNVVMGFIQTETPYYQPNPAAPAPFSVNSALTDPDFSSSCTSQSGNCAEAWGLRIVNSQNILTYGAGLYSFFNNYNTACSNNGLQNCQTNILSLEGGLSNVNFYSLSTVGATNMVVQSGISLAKYSDNVDVYPDTIAQFLAPSSPTGWIFKGCYTDNVSARTLGQYITVPGGQGSTTIESCLAACKAQGYSLAGIEYANECFCDNALRNGGGPAPDGTAGCNMACAGNSNELCGGNHRLDLYQSVQTTTAWSFMGCFTDTTSSRTLGNYITVPGGQGATTRESCQSACQALGYTVSGVEYANECFCDNTVQHGEPAPDGSTGCNMACAGNSAEMCGGNLRIDLFQSTPWTSLGCYTDNTSARTLANYIVVPGGQSATTIETCQAACKAAGYILAGVEYANECFCDNAIQSPGGPASDGSAGCNMACAGNSAEKCGGNQRLNIYQSSSGAVGTPAKKWTSLGCYTDNTSARTLANYESSVANGMTIESCQAFCLGAGYSFAGMEYANECFCDNKIENGAAPASSGCNIACAGNSAEICGGNQRINLYQYA